MADVIRDYWPALLALCFVLFFGVNTLIKINKNDKDYNRAIALEDEYNIYYDGELLDEERKENLYK